MGKKILVAQLGVGNIRNSEYAYFSSIDGTESSEQTAQYIKNHTDDTHNIISNPDGKKNLYSFLAYLEKAKNNKFTDLMLIGTMMSSWKDLLTKAFPDTDVPKEDMDCDKNKYIKKIHDLLIEKLKEEYGIHTYIVIVKNGVTDTEITYNFNEIKKNMKKIILPEAIKKENESEPDDNQDVSIYLDISNAFRSVPMLVFATTNNLSVMHPDMNFKMNVCCSVLESSLELIDGDGRVQKYKMYKRKPVSPYIRALRYFKLREKNKQFKTAIPMIDITIVSEINQWNMAINEFYDSGSVVKLKQLIKGCNEEWFTGKIKKTDIETALEQFSFAVNSNNLEVFINAVKIIINIAMHKENTPSYIFDFVKFLVGDFKHRFGIVEDNEHCYGSLTLAIARWYADQSRLGDAVVALQEGVVSYIIENYYETEKDNTSVKYLFKKRTGKGDKEVDSLSVAQLLYNDECRSLISTLMFSYDEFDDFMEYCKNNKDIETIPEAWKDYLEKYDYICNNLRNPARKVNYTGSVARSWDTTEDNDENRFDMQKAEENVNYCINMMIEGKPVIKEDYIRHKLDYLCGLNIHDFFISYRRKYNTKGDGRERASAVAQELKKNGYDVWWDDTLGQETGEFTPKIREAIRNSKYFIVLLGNGVFNMSLYQEEQPDELQVFYEEIITAYKHFKQDSDDRIIFVSFDDYSEKTDKQNVPLLQNKDDVICSKSEAEKYYRILSRIVNGKLQLHPGKDDVCGIKKLIKDDILEIKSIKMDRCNDDKRTR